MRLDTDVCGQFRAAAANGAAPRQRVYGASGRRRCLVMGKRVGNRNQVGLAWHAGTRQGRHVQSTGWLVLQSPKLTAGFPLLAAASWFSPLRAQLARDEYRQPVWRGDLAFSGPLQSPPNPGLEQVPVHVAGNLTPAQAKAYRLADNRSAEETTWEAEPPRA